MLYSTLRFSLFRGRSCRVPKSSAYPSSKYPRMSCLFFFFDVQLKYLMKIRTELSVVLCTLTAVELQIVSLAPQTHNTDPLVSLVLAS